MKTYDWINLAAILFSPLIAVLVTVYLQDRKERQRTMTAVFFTVVANRHQRLDEEVIKHLNAIDVVFANCRDVRKRWSEYREITEQSPSTPNWSKNLDDKYVELMGEMAKVLGYSKKISQIELSRSYQPELFAMQSEFGAEIQAKLLKVLRGEQAIAIVPYAPSAKAEDKSEG